MIFIYMIVALLIGICLKQHLRDQTVESMPWIFALLVACAIVIFCYWWYKKERTQQFDEVRDLIQGAVECDIFEMQDAYLKFKDMPNIKVIKIQNLIDKLRKVKVTFVFNDQIVGDMEFRYDKLSP